MHYQEGMVRDSWFIKMTMFTLLVLRLPPFLPSSDSERSGNAGSLSCCA
jgi:hypothetical protein